MISYHNVDGSALHLIVLVFGVLTLLIIPSVEGANENEYLTTKDGLNCGSLTNAYGPYDYTNPTDVREKLPIVEKFHFTKNIETLESGNNSVDPGGDLDYTLRAFPNHHRALYALINYHIQTKSTLTAPDAQYPTECYLIRAVAFRPQDANIHLLYGLFLAKTDQLVDAAAQFESAISIDSTNAEAHYNLGLMYFILERLDDAAQHAEVAYDLGYPLPGLRRKLQKAGAWRGED